MEMNGIQLECYQFKGTQTNEYILKWISDKFHNKEYFSHFTTEPCMTIF